MASLAYEYLQRNLRDSSREVQDVDAWKQDHDGAMTCYDFEDFLQLYNRIFDSICELDEDHRERVLRGKLTYDRNWNDRVDALYRWWLTPKDAIESIIGHFEGRIGEVRHADEFRSNCREVVGILESDKRAFDTVEFTKLRDEALREHRRGESLEFRATE